MLNSVRRLYLLLYAVIPSLIWLWCFRTFWTGAAVITGECFAQYAAVKFYLDQIGHGVFPLWNPFLYWGSATAVVLSSSDFNPIWLAVLALNHLGVVYYQAFLIVYIGYFFFGVWGFYLLARAFLRHEKAAYAAALLLMFSGLSIPLFTQQGLLLLFVPGVWFFYFLTRFGQTWTPRYFVGMTLAVMMVLAEYLPFYFTTVVIAAAIAAVLVNPTKIWPVLVATGAFVRRYLLVVLVCACAVMTALVPGVRAYHSTLTQECLIPTRHQGSDLATYRQGAHLNYGEANDGGVTTRMDPEDFWAPLSIFSCGSDGFFFLAPFGFLLLGGGAFNAANRRMTGLLLTGLVLLPLVLDNATPVHAFLFQHTVYFRLFRNLHFFLPFITGVLILLAAEHLRVFFGLRDKSGRERWFWLVVIFVVHLGSFLFLIRQEGVPVSSYWAVGLSWLFFAVLWGWQGQAATRVLPTVLIAAILVQPVELFNYQAQRAKEFGSGINRVSLAVPPVQAKFSYTREVAPPLDDSGLGLGDAFYWHQITSTDSPGFIKGRERDGYPTLWAFDFFLNIPVPVLTFYTRYKFYLYDQVKVVGEKTDFAQLADVLRGGSVAWVSANAPHPELDGFRQSKVLSESQSTAVSGPSERLTVTHFDVNSLRLVAHLPLAKFLVYTDSYDRNWRATIDGKPAKVYRANHAFKGIVLPAGRHQLDLRYLPPVSGYVYVLVLLVYAAMAAWLAALFIRRERMRP